MRFAFVICYSRGATAPPGYYTADHGIVRRASRCKGRPTLKNPFHKRFTPVQYCFNHQHVFSVKIRQFLQSQVSCRLLIFVFCRHVPCLIFWSGRRGAVSMLESRASQVHSRRGYTAWRDVV